MDTLRLLSESNLRYHMVVSILLVQAARVKGTQWDQVVGFKLVHSPFGCNESGARD